MTEREYIIVLGLGRISGQIPDIEFIRLQDIWMISNAGYPVICQILNVGQISGRNLISGIRYQPDIRYQAKKVSGPTPNNIKIIMVRYKNS